MDQVNTNFSAVKQTVHKPLNKATKITNLCRLGQGKSLKGQTEETMLHIYAS